MARACPVTAGCLRLAERFLGRRRAARPDAPDPVWLAHRLNEAIRRGSEADVLAALEAGASVTDCTLDHDGCHTPLELAAQLGRSDLVELIQRWKDNRRGAAS